MKNQIEQALDSREVAEMVEKDHAKLLRDLKRYEKQFSEAKIGFSDFFKESTYTTERGKVYPCYRITKKGCEFIAHKLTGTKGTAFTARYINRFHEMQDIIAGKQQTVQQGDCLPWFIRKFRGGRVMLFRDFTKMTGVEVSGNYTSAKRRDGLVGGHDYNAWASSATVDRAAFLEEYGFDYGDDKYMMYLYPCGIRKALGIYARESGRGMDRQAYDAILDALRSMEPARRSEVKHGVKHGVLSIGTGHGLPVQVKIIVENGSVIV